MLYVNVDILQLKTPDALSEAQVKKIVEACRDNKIRIIPQINLLGHQSWSNNLNPLLTHFPEFDETPHVKMPEKYVWPNDRLIEGKRTGMGIWEASYNFTWRAVDMIPKRYGKVEKICHKGNETQVLWDDADYMDQSSKIHGWFLRDKNCFRTTFN